MASVWLAEDTRLGRPVAVKRLAEGLAADPDFLARFRREAKVAASLSHPNLVRVFDFDAEAEPPFTVMEYVPGPNLAERLERGEHVDPHHLARDLLTGLAVIHAEGVVHRDVKPQNVLMAAGGRAKLADFGVAKPADATSITQTGQILGTSRYMAPELFDGDPATPLSDLFSAGVVIAECLEAGGAKDGALADLVQRLTDPDPTRRPESASAALLMLGYGGARSEDVTAAGPGPIRRIDPSRALPALGAIAAAVVAVVVIVLVSVGGDDPGPSEQPPPARNAPAEAPDEESGETDEPGDGAQGQGEGAASAGGPADPGVGAQLNQQGFDLMNAGDYEAAIPVLRRAVDAFGSETSDINYAYALFNLGRSLRLAGSPDEAVPLLRERMRIPNQRGIVRRELQAALAASDG